MIYVYGMGRSYGSSSVPCWVCGKPVYDGAIHDCVPVKTLPHISLPDSISANTPMPIVDHITPWLNLERFLADTKDKYDMSFGLEYSTVVDWVADLTPRKNHPKAKCYGEVYRGQGSTYVEAIERALRVAKDDLETEQCELTCECDTNQGCECNDISYGDI